MCGTAAEDRQTQVVENVHEFPGHIACDSTTNSEIVVPIMEVGGSVSSSLSVVLLLPSRTVFSISYHDDPTTHVF